MKGIVGVVAWIIALGLILRFGKTSHALAGDATKFGTGILNALTLSNIAGNEPA